MQIYMLKTEKNPNISLQNICYINLLVLLPLPFQLSIQSIAFILTFLTCHLIMAFKTICMHSLYSYLAFIKIFKHSKKNFPVAKCTCLIFFPKN